MTRICDVRLDYWPFLDLEIHDDLEKLIQRLDGKVAFK